MPEGDEFCSGLPPVNIDTASNTLIKNNPLPGKTIALRADMDALPIQEKNDLSFKSKNSNIMHACGHDVHTTILLGAAKILWSLREEFELPEPDPNFTAILDFQSNIFRTELTSFNVNGNLINTDPRFLDAFEGKFSLDTLSPAKDVGIDLGILRDIEGKLRDAQPDLGAFEREE